MHFLSCSWSAKEHRLLRISIAPHIDNAFRETGEYQPLPQSRDAVAGTIGAVGNFFGKAVHAVVEVPDALAHDLLDPNGPEQLPNGPMRRTRQRVGSIVGRVLSRDIFRKPVRTVATAAYETLFELPQNFVLDVPETLSGNTNGTRSYSQAA